MRSVLFLDRDGVILVEPEDEQVDRLEKFAFVPGAISALKIIAGWQRFELVLVTNQDGLGTDSFPEQDFHPLQDLMLRTLEGEGVRFSAVHVDRTFPEEDADTRKPGVGMLRDYLKGDHDLASCFVIGDRHTDIQLARNLGARAIRVASEPDPDADFTSDRWDEIVAYLRTAVRSSKVKRKTSETDVEIDLQLDGNGRTSIQTGLGFFDHMLDQIGRHAGWDLEIRVNGDLHVDEHHTIEDVGIALGEAVREALGQKRGITRYAWVTPMDEARSHVVLDLSGRSTLVWNVVFSREMIGDVPTEMFSHFFRSLSDATRCALHVRAEGENEHHIIEAVFKGVGRCFRQACRVTEDSSAIPSTKGIL
jgi:imidazoleglycerol-phosphate dehydratase/histidinol-phosphatase